MFYDIKVMECVFKIRIFTFSLLLYFIRTLICMQNLCKVVHAYYIPVLFFCEYLYWSRLKLKLLFELYSTTELYRDVHFSECHIALDLKFI